jgi:PadR family transcriptional regulator, regulatory protein AphA
MDVVILGLLMLRERSLYEMKKILEETFSLFYSASFGSLSSALAKMLDREWVTVEEKVEQGRNKKLYAITPAGQAAFFKWMGSPIPGEKVRDPALLRLFFLGFLPPADRARVIERHLAALEALREALILTQRQTAEVPVPPEREELATFQTLTLQYGIDYYTFSLAWFQQLLTSLQEQPDVPHD